ncbi:hypothetical protein P8452_02069 [Trifolium repens]|nr:hypothetical protein P8452_02069 [Trifolium repens]
MTCSEKSKTAVLLGNPSRAYFPILDRIVLSPIEGKELTNIGNVVGKTNRQLTNTGNVRKRTDAVQHDHQSTISFSKRSHRFSFHPCYRTDSG